MVGTIAAFDRYAPDVRHEVARAARGSCRRRRARAPPSDTWSRPCVSDRRLSDAVGGPRTGRAELARRPSDQRLLGIDRHLHAEPAADVARDDVHLGLGMCRTYARGPGARRAGSASMGRACSGVERRRSTPIAPRGSIGLAERRLLRIASLCVVPPWRRRRRPPSRRRTSAGSRRCSARRPTPWARLGAIASPTRITDGSGS